MKNIVKALLLGFNKETNRKPAALVMYRDGVSEGQFLTVLAKELTAIRAACQELPGDYQPPISYLVVQKRHHTRFFPESSGQPQYRNGNALAGTVVDQGINHPTEGDFYLLSHEGIQGTSRPCHYQVRPHLVFLYLVSAIRFSGTTTTCWQISWRSCPTTSATSTRGATGRRLGRIPIIYKLLFLLQICVLSGSHLLFAPGGGPR